MMQNTHLLEKLNDHQRQAVSAPLSNLMVLAGAGSGKTRVLTHRIAWLMQAEGLSPHEIMAVTFTNKAAREMRHRIEELLHINVGGMWVGTFHGLTHRMLRAHWKEAKLPEEFQIIDSEDQHRMIRRIQRSLNLDESRWPPKQTQWYINAQKDKAIRPSQIQAHGELFTEVMLQVYKAYQDLCDRSGLVDFSELLLRSYELLKNNPEIREHYHRRFKAILVDEFQDTNELQYSWLQLLADKNAHIMIVGDDDQSIYSWRGAKVENIHLFQKDYPGTLVVRLEQNYRSTQTILKAANSVIANNDNRMGKNLWTESSEGEPISVFSAYNEIDEAKFIISKIKTWIDHGNLRSESAILYRSNAQSRILEEELIREGIPYRIYGGLKFFDRAEIKDALAYMRMIANRNDDAAFERVVNTPTRGIGNTTLATLRDHAKQHEISLWQATHSLIDGQILSGRARNALLTFTMLIDTLEKQTTDMALPDQMQHVLQESGLIEFFGSEKSEKAQSRVENLEELVKSTYGFDPNQIEVEGLTPLHAFITHTALESGDSQAEKHEDSVQLMTLHSAKGLEFPLVFMCGMEEGLFPHKLSLDDPTGLEEERRLCYVGMTRAMQKLYLCHAECRNMHGKENYPNESRFLKEIPAELKDEVRVKTKIRYPLNTPTFNLSTPTVPKYQPQVSDTGFKLGQQVKHGKFGEGTVMNYEGSGQHARIQVRFSRHGTKWLVASFAKLEAV